MSFHTTILEVRKALGYQEIQGVCHGFSLRWLEAELLNEGAVFAHRALRISQEKQALILLIQKAKAKKGKNLLRQDRELLEMAAFFDSLEVFHLPHKYPHLFDVPHYIDQEDIHITSKVASSDKIIAKGGLKKIYTDAFVFNAKQLDTYLQDLENIINQNSTALKETVGIMLESKEHTIMLSYTPGQGWKFMDINQYPIQPHSRLELASRIIVGFQDKSQPTHVALSASVIITGKDPRFAELTNSFQEYAKKRVVTDETAAQCKKTDLLWIAASSGCTKLITDLAEKWVDFTQSDKNGHNLIVIAAQRGHHEVVAKLIEQKVAADDFQGKEKHTPLYMAAQHGYDLVVDVLLKGKAQCDKIHANGMTPSLIAAQYGVPKVIEVMAEHKVNFNHIFPRGVSPVYMAAQQGHAKALEIMKRADVTTDFNKFYPAMNASPFMVAIGEGHVDAIAVMAKNGANLMLKNPETPVYMAVFKGKTQALAKLVELGAPLQEIDINKQTLAHLAAEKGHAEILAELAKHKMDLNKTANCMLTPLFLAALGGHLDAVKELFKNKVNKDIPLCFSPHPEGTRAYLETRMDVASKKRLADFIKNYQNKNPGQSEIKIYPQEIAEIAGHLDVVAWMKNPVSPKANPKTLPAKTTTIPAKAIPKPRTNGIPKPIRKIPDAPKPAVSKSELESTPVMHKVEELKFEPELEPKQDNNINNPFETQAISASFLLNVLSHPAIKVVALVLLLAGIAAIAVATMGIAPTAVAVVGGGVALVGIALGVCGFFASPPTVVLEEAPDNVPPAQNSI